MVLLRFQRSPRRAVERTVLENPLRVSTADRRASSRSCLPCTPAVTALLSVVSVDGLAEARPATSTAVARPTAMRTPSCLKCTASFPRGFPAALRPGRAELSAPVRPAQAHPSQRGGTNLSGLSAGGAAKIRRSSNPTSERSATPRFAGKLAR